MHQYPPKKVEEDQEVGINDEATPGVVVGEFVMPHTAQTARFGTAPSPAKDSPF